MRTVTFAPMHGFLARMYHAVRESDRCVRVTITLSVLLTLTLTPLVVRPVRRVLEDVGADYSRAGRNEALLGLLGDFPDQVDEPFSRYQLNVALSNRVPLDRAVPDTRHPACAEREYDTSGMDVSVIMPLHDESWSMLLRALHSVVDRTPGALLREVLLIDDASHYAYLGAPLLAYLPVLSPKIRLLRNLRREGLIRSRVRAAKVATGSVLVFLDAHVEVNEGWLEPLLAHIRSYSGRVLAVPHIDVIDPESVKYQAWSQQVHGGFSWGLEYVWKYVQPSALVRAKDWVDPVPSPTTIGCAMAIDREYFFRQGAFDEGMYIWGGENLEISFRMWMCGGRVDIVPCSRVGHVFRAMLPYFFPGQYGGNATRYKNYQRLADVWMDDYRKYYYAASHLHMRYTPEEQASLVARATLRTRLQCQPFSWYLRNVIPDLAVPPPGNVTYFGQISNSRGTSCVTRIKNTFLSNLPLTSCGRHAPDQAFHLSAAGQLRTEDGFCISANKSMKFLQLLPCDHPSDHILQRFSYQRDDTPKNVTSLRQGMQRFGRLTFTYRNRKLCVEQVTCLDKQMLGMNSCNYGDKQNFQLWTFSYQLDFSFVNNIS